MEKILGSVLVSGIVAAIVSGSISYLIFIQNTQEENKCLEKELAVYTIQYEKINQNNAEQKEIISKVIKEMKDSNEIQKMKMTRDLEMVNEMLRQNTSSIERILNAQNRLAEEDRVLRLKIYKEEQNDKERASEKARIIKQNDVIAQIISAANSLRESQKNLASAGCYTQEETTPVKQDGGIFYHSETSWDCTDYDNAQSKVNAANSDFQNKLLEASYNVSPKVNAIFLKLKSSLQIVNDNSTGISSSNFLQPQGSLKLSPNEEYISILNELKKILAIKPAKK